MRTRSARPGPAPSRRGPRLECPRVLPSRAQCVAGGDEGFAHCLAYVAGRSEFRDRGVALGRRVVETHLRGGQPRHLARQTDKEVVQLRDDSLAVVESVEAAGEVDRALREAGLERRIRLASPNFLSLPILLAESDMVATLPVGLASRFVRGGRLTLCPLPIEVPPVPVFALWHALYEHERPQRWLRDTLVSVATECAPTVGLVARV